jgi:hypothetical protein
MKMGGLLGFINAKSHAWKLAFREVVIYVKGC